MNNSQSRSKLRDEVYTQMMFAQAHIVVTLCGKRIRPVVSKPAAK